MNFSDKINKLLEIQKKEILSETKTEDKIV